MIRVASIVFDRPRAVRYWVRAVAAFGLSLMALAANAQVTYPLNGNGTMGLGSANGDFTVAQDDLQVKVPGGYVRINRDYDGTRWVFNRQWSGLGTPAYNKAHYASIGAFFSCTIIDGVNSCDTTASSGTQALMYEPPASNVEQARVPNDPYFGRDAEGHPLQDLSTMQFLARKGVGFSRSTDGTSYVSSKFPRFVVRPQPVPVLPVSAGPDAHPAAGKPGQGGVAVTQVSGFRWTDRTGQWIEYDNLGRISSYGDRNDLRVWFQYGSHGQIERVLDDNGRTVFTLLYTDGSANFIREIRDHTPIDGSIRRVQYQYDDKGRLRHVVDARNNTTSFEYGAVNTTSYDGPGGFGASTGGSSGSASLAFTVNTTVKITKVIDAEGRATAIDYGVTARVTRITAPDQGVTEFEYGYDKLKKEFSTTIKYPQTTSGRKIETRHYDQEGRVVYREVNGKTLMTAQGSRQSMRYTDERSGVVQVERNNFDQVTRRIAEDGTSVNITYDNASADPREVVDEAGVASRLAYDGKGNLLKLTAAAGKPEEQITEYQPDAQGLPQLIRRKGGINAGGTSDPDVEISLRYDASGNVREMVDGEGKTWKYEYDAMGNMLKEIDPLAHEWVYTYDAHGNRLTATDPNQLTTHFSYDKADRLVSLTDPRSKQYQLRYDEAGRPRQSEDPTGATVTLEYDKAGRVTAGSDSLNQRISLAYDSQDRVVSRTDGEGTVTTFDYSDVDGLDRGSDLVSKVNYPALQNLLRYNAKQQLTQVAEISDGETRTAAVDYEFRGEPKSVVNAYSKVVSTEYDALERPKVGKDELGRVVTLGYDHRSNLISITDQLGHTTRLEYDRRNQVVREINAENQATVYVYDDAGRPSEVQRPNGFKLTFDYDAGGRLRERKSYRPDGSLELADSFTWDNGNRLTGWNSGNASSTSTYDDANRRLSESVTIDGTTLTRTYTYYPNGQVHTYTGPDGTAITYAYDGNGNLERVDLPNEGSIAVAERQWTEPSKITLPGGTTQEIERNGYLTPTRLRVSGPSQSPLFEQSSVYGKLGEVTSRTTQAKRIDYVYDDAMRLKEANPSGWGGTETFELDHANNRLSDSVVSSQWEYDDANRLIRRGSVEYRYDPAGNLIQKIDAGRAEPLRTTHYAYDGYNRLVEVRDGAGEVVARYAYDPFGYRLSKEVTSIGAANSGATAGKRVFLQGEEGLLAEVAADGTVLQSYGWQPGNTYSTDPLFLHRGADYFYYHNDPLGMPRMLTDKAGNVVWAASEVGAFGFASLAAGSSVEQPWRFPGQYFDAETGLHYNVHRYYDPVVGRYTSEDPLGLSGGLNRYAYADASPTNFIDIYGLNVGAPGFFESFIPVWGSAREAVNDFQCGRYIWGTINTVLAITDATGIGYGVKALAKGGFKTAKNFFKAFSKTSNWNNMRNMLQKMGEVARNSRAVSTSQWLTTDHIFVKQAWDWPHWITNFPLNLQYPVTGRLNNQFERMGLLERMGYMESWRKAAIAGIGSYLLGLLPQPKGGDDEGDGEEGSCDCN
ncbi:RHS repeat-associated core domain-containing protein [Lysobacter terrae]